MIESIEIKNVATYDHVGVKINDLKKVNFFYGTNGCGKTTISNFLYNSNDNKFSGCSLIWSHAQELTTLVYNKEFRERNFGRGKLGGVFTLGQATTEQIKAIDDKKEILRNSKNEASKKKETLDSQKNKREDLEIEFKEFSWTRICKKYDVIFKEAFIGHLTKEHFKNRLLKEFASNGHVLQTIEDLNEKAKTIFGEIPQKISSINTISFLRIIEIENNGIWKKIIVGKADVDIASLIQKLNIHDWVNQGRSFLHDEVCPFCQQSINNDFKDQMEVFFDESYSKDIRLIKDLKQEYTFLMQNLINELNVIEIREKNFKSTKLSVDKYSAYLKTLISQNSINNEILNNKILNNKVKEPSRSVELVSLKEQLDLISELITDANAEIDNHNSIVLNFNEEKIDLINSVWSFIINEFRTEINRYITSKNGLESGVTALQKQLETKLAENKALDSEIKNLSKNVTGIQPTINELNRLLRSYGFLNFEIVPAPEDGFYRIQREDGTIAETTLSEGEVTFITFLYFLQLAKGGSSEETVNDDRVLVIDDPVSSLDSNVLFVVSTLIKEIIKNIKVGIGNIKQIILLTHNVYFHKEVSFIDGRTKRCGMTNFWILRKNNRVTNLLTYKIDNPIQSSYELLWSELKSNNERSSITIQNVMRRIIENYFKLLGKYGDDDLIQKFETKEEQEICRSLIGWINDGSHSINDDLFVEQQDRTISIYREVFKKIFVLTNHEAHYNMMHGEGDLIAL